MNKSPRVDALDCLKCGKCCLEFKIRYPLGMTESEIYELVFMTQRVGISARAEPDDRRDCTWLIFDHPCKHLDTTGGEYRCKIYNEPSRPPNCAWFPYPDATEEDCPHLIKENVIP